MSIRITHARSDERGKASGGSAGDQTGKEICTTDFYVHPKGWNVIRPLNAAEAAKIAQTALAVAKNDHFGYDQEQRLTGITEAKKVNYAIEQVTTDCELDCSSLVRLCCLAAGIEVSDFYTGNEVTILKKTGHFTSASYAEGLKLLTGDILCTKTKGHTVIVTTGDDTATAVNGWQKSGTSYYYYENGLPLKSAWVKSNGHWYRLGTDGKMLTGWHKIYDKSGKLRDCYFEEKDTKLLGAMWHEASDGQGYLEVWSI